MVTAHIEAVVFDAVGTLLHPDPGAAEVYAEVGRSLGSRYSKEDVVERFADAFAREEDADVAAGLRTNEARECRRWADIVARVLDDVSDPVGCFQKLYQHFATPSAWRCDADAATVMKALTARGLHLGIASNYDSRLRSVTAGFPELQGLALIVSSKVGWRKPAPEFFAALCAALQTPPAKVLYVGDDLANDYDGARAAGLQALLFDPRGRHDADGIKTIPRLRDLVP